NRATLARVSTAPTLRVNSGTSEVSMVARAVTLRGQQRALRSVARDRALDKEHVGLLARLEHAELGIEGTGARHHPIGPRQWSSFGGGGCRPRTPALALARLSRGKSQRNVER